MNRRFAIALGAMSAVVGPIGPASALEKVPAASTQGQPVMTPGEGPAYFLYSDEKGWHLRWTGKAGPEKTAFTGLISVPGAKISMIKPAGMVGGDDSVGRMDKVRAFFKSEATSAVEGLDFTVPPEAGSIYLELFIGYDTLAAASVFLGKDRVHPTEIYPMLQIDLGAK